MGKTDKLEVKGEVLNTKLEKHEMPNDFAMYITDFIGLASVELGILLYVTKRKTNTYNIKSQIPLLKHATVKEYLTFIPLMAIGALLISALLNPIESMIKENFFLSSQQNTSWEVIIFPYLLKINY